MALACKGGEVLLGLAGDQLGQQPLEPVHGLDPQSGELLAAVAQHPQRLELTIGTQHTQGLGADRDDRDGVGIQRVGLAVVAGVEEPDPGRELGRHVHHVLAGLEQTLGQWSAGAVASLDRPDPLRPRLRIGPHRGVTGLVGAEPARAEQLLVAVDDLDGGRELVGIDPDDHLRHRVLLLLLVPIGTARWAVLLRAGQSPFEPRLACGSRRIADRKRATPQTAGGQPRGEPSVGHLDRVWPDTDPVAIV
jgi:hypothetical protein